MNQFQIILLSLLLATLCISCVFERYSRDFAHSFVTFWLFLAAILNTLTFGFAYVLSSLLDWFRHG